MKKQLTAFLTAAALILCAAPMTVLADDIAADEPTALPEWVPKTYSQAVDFCNTYGKTHVEDGYVCLVRRGSVDLDMNEGFAETRSEEPLSQFIPEFIAGENPEDLPAVPGANDDGFSAPIVPVEPRYQFEVSVYHPKNAGELKITWAYGTAAVSRETVFTFNVDDKGRVSETDVFGWLPDSMDEFYTFEKANPVLSLHNGYIAYVANPCYDGGFQDYLSMIGTGGVEEIQSYHLGTLYISPELPCGDPTPVVKLFRPVKAGNVQMIASERRPWVSDDPVYSDLFCYTISDDLKVKEVKQFEETYGDCNGDGELSVLDLVVMRKYLHGQGTLEHPELADLDGDGQVDIFDFAILRQRLFVKTPWEKPQALQFETAYGGKKELGEKAQPTYDYTARTYFTYKTLMQALPDQKKDGDDYTPGLKTISKETFEDKAVILLTSPTGAAGRRIEVEGVERTGATLKVNVRTHQVPGGSMEKNVLYTLVVVDKSMVADGLRNTVVNNKETYPMPPEG